MGCVLAGGAEEEPDGPGSVQMCDPLQCWRYRVPARHAPATLWVYLSVCVCVLENT